MADDVDDVTTDVVETFREQLGPELEYLADGLAPAVTGLVGRAVEHAIDERARKAEQTKAAEAATTAVMTTFGERHPDWQAHEPAMLALAQKVQPQQGMTETEWLGRNVTGRRSFWQLLWGFGARSLADRKRLLIADLEPFGPCYDLHHDAGNLPAEHERRGSE